MMTNDQALVQGVYIYQADSKNEYYQIIHIKKAMSDNR